MSHSMDVMVSNHTDIDWEVFDLWLDGTPEGICVTQLRDSYPDHDLPADILIAELHNQYRLFGMLEPILHQPTIFSEQLVWQIDKNTQDELIKRYYALDDTVARELLGRKLSGRLRKDLDEVSEKTGSSLKSCRRQFDNIKRIFKGVEEMPGRFITNIRSTFNLADPLNLKYSVIIFIGVHRLETTKKKLYPVSFRDFSIVARAIMQNWTSGIDVDDQGDPVLDRDFFAALRELKAVQDREKEHKYVFIDSVNKCGSKRLTSDMEAHFKSFNRNVIGIGSSLHHNKEMKDIFINTWEKIVEPLKQQRFSNQELDQILDSYEEILTLSQFQLDSELNSIFLRFFTTLRVMISTFYAAMS